MSGIPVATEDRLDHLYERTRSAFTDAGVEALRAVRWLGMACVFIWARPPGEMSSWVVVATIGVWLLLNMLARRAMYGFGPLTFDMWAERILGRIREIANLRPNHPRWMAATKWLRHIERSLIHFVSSVRSNALVAMVGLFVLGFETIHVRYIWNLAPMYKSHPVIVPPGLEELSQQYKLASAEGRANAMRRGPAMIREVVRAHQQLFSIAESRPKLAAALHHPDPAQRTLALDDFNRQLANAEQSVEHMQRHPLPAELRDESKRILKQLQEFRQELDAVRAGKKTAQEVESAFAELVKSVSDFLRHVTECLKGLIELFTAIYSHGSEQAGGATTGIFSPRTVAAAARLMDASIRGETGEAADQAALPYGVAQAFRTGAEPIHFISAPPPPQVPITGHAHPAWTDPSEGAASTNQVAATPRRNAESNDAATDERLTGQTNDPGSIPSAGAVGP